MAYSSGSIFSSIAMSWNSLDSKISRHSRHSTNSLSCCRATICTLGCGQGALGVEAGLVEGTVAAGCGETEPGLLGTVLITSYAVGDAINPGRRISAHCSPAISAVKRPGLGATDESW